MLILRIDIIDCSVTKTINFDPKTIVYDACQIVRDKVPEALNATININDYGLFYTEENKKRGIWLEPGKTLEHYVLRNGDILEFKKKIRTLKVKMLDESIKTLVVDDSHTLAQIMITICSKIGITNHEEYSLVRDLSDVEKEKTLTMKRDKSIAKDQKKMDEMKKKLHTDDELDWLDHTKSLRDQGVDEGETLLLRRKYFFSDQNVDTRDPIQLHLLYVQTRDNIMKGALPVNMEKAVEFAGIQCQIQYGDHNETKHKSGFLELKEFLPKEYCRVKNIEKKIFMEHKSQKGLQELEAKAKYTQLARSLPTYGIAFFLVKEKVKGKNKLTPTLLGITKESVVKLDEKKEIVKVWPLTTVRRWAASPNTFTLDFGDYADSYYCVQTLEGEQIAQLISGYIDIILKKKAAKDYMGFDGDEESTMYEDSVSPARATIIQHHSENKDQATSGHVSVPAILRSGEMGSQGAHGSIEEGQMSSVSQFSHFGQRVDSSQNAGSIELVNAQRALLGRIDEGLRSLNQAENDFNSKAPLPHLGADPASINWRETTVDNSKQKVGAQLSAMNTATAQVVMLTGHQPQAKKDITAVGAAVQAISSNMGNFSRDIRMLAALNETEEGGDNLLVAAKSLASAFKDLLSAAQAGTNEPRQSILNAANRVGEASQNLIHYVEPEDQHQKDFKENLILAARKVANATSSLVMTAKSVSSNCSNKADQNKIIEAATQCALSSSQLVACSRVLAGTIDDSQCQEQLIDAAKTVASSVNTVVDVSQDVCKDPNILNQVNDSADQVNHLLDEIISQVKKASNKNDGLDQVDSIFLTSDRICNNCDDSQELVKQSKTLAQATSLLVHSLKNEADQQSDSNTHHKLLSAAKALADATAKMVEAAKSCANNPEDSSKKQELKIAADNLKSATSAAAAGALKQFYLSNLQQATKNATTAAAQLINAADVAGQWNNSQQSQQQLMSQCNLVADDHIPRIVQALRLSQKQPENLVIISQLSDLAHQFIQPCNKLLSSSKAALPTITDESANLNLNQSCKKLANAIAELISAVEKFNQAGPNNSVSDVALEKIKIIKSELQETKTLVLKKELVPLPGEDLASCGQQLGAASKQVATAMAQLVTAATQGCSDFTDSLSNDVAESLKRLANSARGVAATTTNQKDGVEVVDHALDVADQSSIVLQQAKFVANNPSNLELVNNLAKATKEVSQSLGSCVGCLPGVRDVDKASRRVQEASSRINQPFLQNGEIYKGTECGLDELQLKVTNQASDLSKMSQDLLLACQDPSKSMHHISKQTNHIAKVYENFLDDTVTIANLNKDPESKNKIISDLRGVSSATSKFLAASKSLLSDPEGPGTKALLTQAARQVTESINNLISTCSVASPTQKHSDDSIRQIQSLKLLANESSAPLSQESYFECLSNVIDNSKLLAEWMPLVSSSAQKSDSVQFCRSVDNFTISLSAIVQNASQAAYIVGVSDVLSEPGKEGVINKEQITTASDKIHQALEVLIDKNSNQQQVLNAVSAVANHTSTLCNACRQASSKTNNPVAKRQFFQSAKDLANNTANMVKAMKAASENKERGEPLYIVGRQSSGPLLNSLEVFSNFALVPEFIGKPAKISKQGKEAQKPIFEATKLIIETSENMIGTAKQLVSKPQDQKTFMGYSSQSHNLSEAIKALLSSMREKQPGKQECEKSLEEISNFIHDLDQASLAAVSRDFSFTDGKSLEMNHEQVVNSGKQLLSLVKPLTEAAEEGGGNFGQLVQSMTSYLSPFKIGLLGIVSKTTNSKTQIDLLDQCRTVAESLHNLLQLSKQIGENKKDLNLKSQIDEASVNCQTSISELVENLEEKASSSGLVSTLVDNLNKSIAEIGERHSVEKVEGSFVDHQTNIVKTVKQLAKTAQEMNTKVAANNVQDLGVLAKEISSYYDDLVKEGQKACFSCPNAQMGGKIKQSIRQLGPHLVSLVQNAGTVQCSPQDVYAKREMNSQAKKVAEFSTNILTVLQTSARGTQACINASSTINGLIADLDTSIMFATAGTLNSDPGDVFGDHREGILRTAKELVEDTKQLVAGAALNQDQLAETATKSVSTAIQLSECIKKGAASLGSEQAEAQVLLMNAAKDVASALSDLIGVTKLASGKPSDHPHISSLRDSAKVMVTNVTSLLKTVKTVENEVQRATQALESSIEAISQEIKSYSSTDRQEKVVSPDQVIQMTRPIAIATTKAVAAGTSGCQEDVISAANLGRKAVIDLLKFCKGSLVGVEEASLRERMKQAGFGCASSFRELLLSVQQNCQNPSQETKAQLGNISKKVAFSVTEVVHAAEAIKGVDWVDPLDPTVIAENELLSAANSIEAAAKKLASLQPKLKPKQADESLNFEEQLLEAAKSIASATGALVKAASAAQKELVFQGKIGVMAEEHDSDSQWSQGLISAAKHVALATHSLCDAANAMVQGQASEEKLISSAKQVASSTAQLLIACKVKADPNSLAMKRLHNAGQAVKKATEALVREAQKMKGLEQEVHEQEEVTVNKKMVSDMAQIIMAQEEILKKEKELELARKKLETIRKAKYRGTEDEP